MEAIEKTLGEVRSIRQYEEWKQKKGKIDAKYELHSACEYGDKGIVKLILAKNADINTEDKYDKTAPIWAAMMGHTEVVQELLQVPGIEVNAW